MLSRRLSRANLFRATACLAAFVAAAAACTLNPQPLPPEATAANNSDGGGATDSGVNLGAAGDASRVSDTAQPPNDPDAQSDGAGAGQGDASDGATGSDSGDGGIVDAADGGG
jgi:hypothetical protein